MVKTYMESDLGDEQKKRRIRSLLDQGWKAVKSLKSDIPYHCCINTELNSTNFLVNDRDDNEKEAYLVDWEKHYMEIRPRIWDISWHLQLLSGKQM